MANTDSDATADYRESKEAMEPPIITSKRTLEALSASLTLQPDQDAVVEIAVQVGNH